MRTTINIADPILKELKRLRKEEGKSLDRLVTDLLTQPLDQRGVRARPGLTFRWISKRMGARVNLDDRDTLLGALGERRG